MDVEQDVSFPPPYFHSWMTSGLPLYLSHIGFTCRKGGKTYGNDAQTEFGKWSDCCKLQSRWTDVPFTELNVIGWHFPACLMESFAEYGQEQERKALIRVEMWEYYFL